MGGAHRGIKILFFHRLSTKSVRIIWRCGHASAGLLTHFSTQVSVASALRGCIIRRHGGIKPSWGVTWFGVEIMRGSGIILDSVWPLSLWVIIQWRRHFYLSTVTWNIFYVVLKANYIPSNVVASSLSVISRGRVKFSVGKGLTR